jgi:hypothetical protein
VAIAVVINPRAARAVAHVLLTEAGLGGDIGEGAVAVVPVQHVVTVAGDEQVLEPIVVVIADPHRGRHPVRVSPAFSVTSLNVPSRLFLYNASRTSKRTLRPLLGRSGIRGIRRNHFLEQVKDADCDLEEQFQGLVRRV